MTQAYTTWQKVALGGLLTATAIGFGALARVLTENKSNPPSKG